MRRRLEGIMDRERGGGWWRARPGLDGDAVLDLLERPWFERVWVIQEICRAREEEGAVVFACGDGRIAWEKLWAAVLFLALWMMRETRAIGDSEWAVVRDWRLRRFVRRMGMDPARSYSPRAAQTLGTRKKYLQGDLQNTLKGLLLSLYVADSENPLQCRDPEDKIRALRGLASDGEMLDGPGFILPGISWNHLYTRLARHVYGQGDLDFLSLCRCRNPVLPSWVTDWSQQQRPPWLGYAHAPGGAGASSLFNAGKGTQARVYENEGDDDDMEVLCLEGFTVDTISEVGSEWTAHLSEDFSWESASLRIADIDHFLSRSQLYSAAEKAAARWRILVADRMANDVNEHVRATTTRAAEESFARLEAIITNSFLRGTGSLGAWYYPYRSTLLSLWSSRPFLSSKGYVGLCPGTASQGDTVIIPGGSHCPYVVRSRGQQGSTSPWELLGEAYVHGVMDGELDLGRRGGEAERFRLV